MPAKIIDGKKVAKEIRKRIKAEIQQLDFRPGLAVFLIGQDKPSHLYVSLKEKACKEIGIDFHKYMIDEDVSEEEIINSIHFINQDNEVDAILVQVPVPEKFDQKKIIETVNPDKDVDGFHPITVERFLSGQDDFMPGLAQGIVRLVEETGEEVKGKSAVVAVKSEIFYRPIEKLLSQNGIKVEHVQPEDKDFIKKTRTADILITVMGKPHFIKADMIKKDAIIIDVGITKQGKKTLGDVDYDDVADKAAYITPVPGGVGPVTVAMLLENTLKLAKKHRGLKT